MRTLRVFLATLLLLGPAGAGADMFMRAPVVTQLQGAVFYKTSITIGQATAGNSAGITLRLSYRSPVDGTMQHVSLNAGQLGPYRVLFEEDIIERFKQSGLMRAADVNSPIFGTLLVTFDAADQSANESLVEARTYSPANGGGTNGIAYIGRNRETAGSEIVKAAVRDGTFGADGTTRTNIGFVNEGSLPTDVDIQYRDGATGQLLRQFTHAGLQPGEVFQFNNIFAHASIPAATRTIIVRGQALANNARISGYGVQLDSVTNDGSFFLFSEEEEPCEYTPPG